MARYRCASALLLLLGLQSAISFQPSFSTSTTISTTTALWGKVKRGKLGREVDQEAASSRTKISSSSTKKKTSSASSSGGNANISPALAEWMAQQEDTSSQNADIESTADTLDSLLAEEDEEESASTYTKFDKGKKNKKSATTTRIKQSARKAAEDARDERVEQIVKLLQEKLEEKSKGSSSIEEILTPIRELLELPTMNFKQLTAGAQRQDFRLAWVGSDDAICHVGTGLHKVPLARLQEVFLSFMGRNRIEVQEVIRILGPFPNVKNTLQGDSTFNRKEDAVEWKVTWDSMVDGTGNEILAGKQENVRRVDLQVYFSSPSVVVAVVPPEIDNMSARRADPLEENGKHVLLFVREDNLVDQLEMLRVA